MITELRPGLFRVADTCHVYVFRPGPPGSDAVCVDFGSGEVLDHLAELGVGRITDVLMTHHHRDQGQGLGRAVANGVRVWVPPVEQDLFARADEFWAGRRLRNDYVTLTDRFSLLEPIAITGTVPEYRTRAFGPVEVHTLPTPGHTPGSVTYLVRHGGELVACTGDLIHSPGRVWSLAATQWTYTGNEGPAMTAASALTLAEFGPDLLLPSHGEPMDAPAPALDALVDNLEAYLDARRPDGATDMRARLADPFIPVSDHLLMNAASEARTWVLLSETGEALFIDYGYDSTAWFSFGGPRWGQRPMLASLPALRRRYGVTAITAALATHYHDDHVAGLNLLRDVEGTPVWAPENVAPMLEHPMTYDLPCQWFEPVEVDRVLRFGEPVAWNEYAITTHSLPGHTLYAGAFEFEVDGVRVLAVGDQQDGLGEPGVRRDLLNYQYRNQFRYGDYVESAELYRRVAPGLMVAGHWTPRACDAAYFDRLAEAGRLTVEHHEALLPLAELDLPASGAMARLVPYVRTAAPGDRLDYRVELHNPHPTPAVAHCRLVVPPGWDAPAPLEVAIPARGDAAASVTLGLPPGFAARRAVLALDVTIGDLRLGQHCEAVVEAASADR